MIVEIIVQKGCKNNEANGYDISTMKVFLSYNHEMRLLCNLTHKDNQGQNMFQVIFLYPPQYFFSYSYVLQYRYELDICYSVCVLSFPACVV